MAWGKDTPASVFGASPAPWNNPAEHPPPSTEVDLDAIRCPLASVCKTESTFGKDELWEHLQTYHHAAVKPNVSEDLSLDPSPEELEDQVLACARLWELDFNRLVPGKDFSLNLGSGKFVWDTDDGAEDKLFGHVSEQVWSRDTFRAFMQLLDNYEASTEVEDMLSGSEIRETYQFLDEILQEPVMQYVHKYLQAVGKAPAETDKFARQLYRLWFWSYGRGEARRASSGFEHVFIGEIDSKDGEKAVAGLHNWIQFYFLERSDALDYRGYVLPRKVTGNDAPDGDEQFLSVQFEWMGERKPVSGMFVGVSPEFEFALYTLLYYCGGEDNVVRLGDLEVNVKVYRLDRIGCISTAFPEAA